MTAKKITAEIIKNLKKNRWVKVFIWVGPETTIAENGSGMGLLWKGKTPSMEVLGEVVAALRAAGYRVKAQRQR